MMDVRTCLREFREENDVPEIVEIKGVGPVLAKACASEGYGSVEKIAGAMVVELVAVPGVSDVRAKQLIDSANSLLNGGSSARAEFDASTTAAPDDTGVGKAKSKKAKKSKKKGKKQKGAEKADKKVKKTKKNKKNKKKSKKK